MSIRYDGFETQAESVRIREFPTTMLGTRNRALTSLISSMKPGEMVLAEQQFYGVFDNESLTASFIENEDFSKGRTCSAHGVKFGQLVLESTFDQELPTHIAVKPFPSRGVTLNEPPIKALVHEWAATDHVAGLSNYERVYLPLGLWKDTKGTPQMITLFDEQSQTLDNVFWARGKVAANTGQEKIISALCLSLYALGILHGAGLTHGDPQIKDFARDSKHIRFVDLTELELMQEDTDVVINSYDNKKAIRNDLKWLTLSALDQQQRPNDMFEKVAAVITNETIIRGSAKFYDRGVIQGEYFSRKTTPQSLLIKPDELVHGFLTSYIINAEREHRPVDKKVVGAITGTSGSVEEWSSSYHSA